MTQDYKTDNFRFEATCGVCGSTYEHLGMPSEASLKAGTFCLTCKENKRMGVGILHWEYRSPKADYLTQKRRRECAMA